MQPCRMLVFPLPKVTMLAASVSTNNGRSPPSIPSVIGRCVTIPIVSTAGIVRPIDASTEPCRMLTERWS